MRDVDALSRGRHVDDDDTTDLINEYERIAGALYAEDRDARQSAYTAATFPEHALRTSATVSINKVTARPHVSSCHHAKSFVCSPVRFGADITANSAAKTPELRAIDHLIQTRITMAWVSIDSKTGSIPWSLQGSHHALSQMAILVTNSDANCNHICSYLFPSDTTSHETAKTVYGLLQGKQGSDGKRINSNTAAFLQRHATLTGADFNFPFEGEADQRLWLSQTLDVAQYLVSNRNLQCIVLILTETSGFTPEYKARQFCLRNHWDCCSKLVNSSRVGDNVAAIRWVSIMTRKSPERESMLDTIGDHNSMLTVPRYGDSVRPELNVAQRSSFQFHGLPQPDKRKLDPHKAASLFQVYGDLSLGQHVPIADVFDPDFPAPEPQFRDTSAFSFG